LILRQISNFDATRCQILRLKCTKFDFRGGSAQTPLGEPTATPDPLAVFKGSKGRGEEGGEVGGAEGLEGEGEGKGRRSEQKGEEREGKEGKGMGHTPPPIF